MAGKGTNLEELSKQVNDIFNYVNEYRKRNIKANGNDMMALYNIVSEYDDKISDFMKNTRSKTNTGNQAQYMDLIARHADAHDNRKTIAEAIVKSMEENAFDADKYKNKLSKLLSDKDKNKKEVKDLFDALTGYDNVMKNSAFSAIDKANAKVKLVNSCIGYIKNARGNSDAMNTVYDIAAAMELQNIKAFDNLTNEQLSSLPAKKHVGYKYTNGNKYVAKHIDSKFAENAPEELNKLLSSNVGKSQQEKEAAYEKYLNYMYGKDRNANHADKDKVFEELGPNPTEEEKYVKLGELGKKISEKMPWQNIKLDDTATSKEKFTHRQEVMRQWFPDDTALLFGSAANKNKARSFLDDLSNSTYNGYFRSRQNSPEYTELIDALKTYTDSPEKNTVKDEANLKAVKDACNKYLQHYEDKDSKKKTEFAKMRRNKVEQLLVTLGGKVNVITKDSKKVTKDSKVIAQNSKAIAKDSKEKAKAPETVKQYKKLFRDNAQFKALLESQKETYSASAEKVVEQVNSGKDLNLKDLARAFVDRGIVSHLEDMENKEISSGNNRATFMETVRKIKRTNYEIEIEKLTANPLFINASKELKQGECSEGAINKLFTNYAKETKKSEEEVTMKNTQKTTNVEKDLEKKGWVIK